MVRTFASRVLSWAILASLAVAVTAAAQPALGADGAGAVKKMLGRKGRRLPAHYAAVVTEEQREKIYKIQEEYQPKFEALEMQIKALRKDRDEKIAALLTPEQKQKIGEVSGKAKKEKAKSAEKAAPLRFDNQVIPPEEKPAK